MRYFRVATGFAAKGDQFSKDYSDDGSVWHFACVLTPTDGLDSEEI
jgi:hypothetical protein